MTVRRLVLLAGLAIVGLVFVWNVRGPLLPQEENPQTFSYICNEDKTITATAYKGQPAPTPAPGEPPTPTGRANISLSDGRDLSLKQTISADGVRYANDDESFVFWNKGNGALVLENNVDKSYIGCILVAPDPGGLPQVYHGVNFTLRFPIGYAISETYKYQHLGPGKEIAGVSFNISTSTYEGTNLSSDTYISVETLPDVSECTAVHFYSSQKASTTTDAGVEYSVIKQGDAAAGNRYEETVYALSGTNPCVAVRHVVHYGFFDNYPEGAKKEFDKMALLKEFDAIRRTLVVAQ